jgi:hypothetical protein
VASNKNKRRSKKELQTYAIQDMKQEQEEYWKIRDARGDFQCRKCEERAPCNCVPVPSRGISTREESRCPALLPRTLFTIITTQWWTKNTFIACIDLRIHRNFMLSCPNVDPSATYAPYGEPLRMHAYKHKARSRNTNLPPSATYTKKKRAIYLSFFLAAPLTFAVPRRVFCLFLRCLPVPRHISMIPTRMIHRYDSRRTLLSAGLLDLCCHSYSDQAIMGLKLLQRFWRIVHERKTGCLSTTVLCLQTEDVDLVLVGLVHFGELASEFILGDVGAVGMENITIRVPLESQFQF